MKLSETVGAGQFPDLRRKRDTRTFDDAEKIGARLKMRAARDPKQHRRQWEKTLHAAFLPERGDNDKP